jgi:hypothetical protein
MLEMRIGTQFYLHESVKYVSVLILYLSILLHSCLKNIIHNCVKMQLCPINVY